MKDADLIVLNGSIISESRTFKGALAIRNGEIVEIGSSKDIKRCYDSKKEIDATGKLVMPGLTDGHTHNVQVMLRGSFTDRLLSLPPIWLNYLIPYESFLDPEDVKKCSLLTQLSLIKSGTTSFIEAGGPHPHKIAEATEKSGLRGCISKSTIDVGSDIPMYQETDEIVDDYRKLIESWDGKSNGRIKVWISLREVMLNSLKLFDKLYSFSEKYGSGITLHLAESRAEVDYCLENFGKRPVELVYDNEYLTENVLAAHMIFVNVKEMKMLKESGAHVVWCPEVDAYVMGPSKANEMVERDVNVIFGTDGGSWNNLDLFEQGRHGITSVKMMSNALYHDKAGLKYENAFEMLTSNAENILNEPIGRIKENYKADIVILNPNDNLVPSYDAIYTIVNMASSKNVDTVIVDGEILMEEGKVRTLNEEKIIKEARELEEDIKEKIDDLKDELIPKNP